MPLVRILNVIRQVGEGGLDRGVVAGAISNCDPRAQRFAVLAANHRRRAQQEAADPRHLALFERLADEAGPDLPRGQFFRQRNGLETLIHRHARGGDRFGRRLEGRALVAIGLRNQMRRHERRHTQRTVEDERCIGCKWNSTFATTVHRVASVTKKADRSGQTCPRPACAPQLWHSFFAGTGQRSRGQDVCDTKNRNKRMTTVHVPKRT